MKVHGEQLGYILGGVMCDACAKLVQFSNHFRRCAVERRAESGWYLNLAIGYHQLYRKYINLVLHSSTISLVPSNPLAFVELISLKASIVSFSKASAQDYRRAMV